MKKTAFFWFTGLSGSGKTTVANGVQQKLKEQGYSVLTVDGDQIRESCHGHLGFSSEDITKNNALIAEMCKKNDGKVDVVLIPIISPFKASRLNARQCLGKRFFEIHFSACLDHVVKHDVKGLYGKAKNNIIKDLIGFSKDGAPYEAPENPDFTVCSETQSCEQSIDALLNFILSKVEKKMNVGVIVQARMKSERLPGKVLMPVKHKPLLGHLIGQLQRCTQVQQIVIATSNTAEDDPIEEFCREQGLACFRGREDDVLDRYYQCARQENMGAIVRVTGDCPLINPGIIDHIIEFYTEHREYDLVKTGPLYPEGFDAEICSFESLELAWKEAKLKSDREHVTPYLWKNEDKFRIKWLTLDQDYSFLRLTVDEPVDFEVVKTVIETVLEKKKHFVDFQDVLDLHQEHPEIFEKNAHVIRNEGYLKSVQRDS